MTVPVYKLLLVGNANVGKSSLIRRVLLGEFDPAYCATAGVDLSAIAINVDAFTPVILTCIDLGGQEDFSALRTQYYKGAHSALLVFDVTSRESFESLPSWHRGLESTLSSVEKRDLRGFVVANKVDMSDKRVTSLEALRFSESIGWPYIETSAKTGLNVDGLFKRVAKTLFTQYPPMRR